MSDLSDRIAKLSPEKRALLERQVKKIWEREPSVAGESYRCEKKRSTGLSSKKTITDRPGDARPDKGMQFSLFYFASEESDASSAGYRLLLEGARFADRHGFTAVWTPERHFHAFGGLYPNPSLTSAVLAMITERIHLRSGSVVLPLHHPIRIAEEWSFVDNISKGRVGIAFASGWHANDFVFHPENYAARKEVMFRGIETVRRLWRGESVAVPSGSGNEIAVKIFPKPVQPELPVWITAAGNPDTFIRAGEMGANVLTHLLGQTVEEVAEKAAKYRQARAESGHDPQSGHITLMLHTFVADHMEYVRETVRKPFCDYIRMFTGLLDNLAKSLQSKLGREMLTADDMDALQSFAFERYFTTSGLFGTPASCVPFIDRLKAIGVDEVACLIDFGVDADTVLSSLYQLNELRELCNPPQVGEAPSERAEALSLG